MANFKTVKKVTGGGKVIPNFKLWRKKNPNAIFFDSKFEYSCYMLLNKAKFNFTFHPESRELRPKFQTLSLSGGKGARKLFRATVRSISYTSDFAIYCNDGTIVYVEAKGFFHPDARLRYKLFQASLKNNEISVLVLQKNKGDVDMKGVIKIVNEQFGGSSKDVKPKGKTKKLNMELL